MTSKIREDSVAASVIGIDIGKEVFHLVGFSADGRLVLRQKIKRLALEATFKKLPPCIIGMEACLSAHFVSRTLRGMGFEPRIIPAIYVKPFNKGQKNDYNDAEAIAEAALRPKPSPKGQTYSFAPSGKSLTMKSFSPLASRLRAPNRLRVCRTSINPDPRADCVLPDFCVRYRVNTAAVTSPPNRSTRTVSTSCSWASKQSGATTGTPSASIAARKAGRNGVGSTGCGLKPLPRFALAEVTSVLSSQTIQPAAECPVGSDFEDQYGFNASAMGL